MTSKPISQSKTPSPELRLEPIAVGDMVRTPTSGAAEVIAVYLDAEHPEALVQWTSGDRARFRLSLLKKWAAQ